MTMLVQLTQLIKSLTPNIRSQLDLDDAYLSESADVYELEFRIREIDQRRLRAASCLAYRHHYR